jgi:N-acetylmuramoyl-L-alanine amidase
MPTNPLLDKLAQLYKNQNIPHPNLKEVTLAQWMLESGRATSELATKHFNFGGLKWRSEMSPFATRVSYQAHDGVDDYCKFANIESFIRGYWAFIGRAPYAGWEDHAGSAEDYIRFIGSKYTPTPGYADRVLELVPESRTLLESVGPITEGGTATTTLPSLGTIVIDPGHGGTTKIGFSSWNNATSFSGALEKHLTLDFSRILRESLLKLAQQKNKQIKVVLTRNEDVNVGLQARANFAATHKADLFICLHFNGFDDESVRGVETYYAKNGNVNFQADLDFARKVNNSLFSSLKSIDSQAEDRGVKPDTDSGPGSLMVLKDEHLGNLNGSRKCRACYVELEFISNERVDRSLISGPNASANRRLVMGNLAATLVDYLEEIN